MKRSIKVFILLGTLIILCFPIFNSKDIYQISNFSKKYEAPANINFSDQNFYNCVVDAYNKENKTNLPYTTNLSYEQLQTITSLTCSGNGKQDTEKIKSTNGLDKLTALTFLDVSENQLTKIDVSRNIALTYLTVYDNQLTELDVSKNTALTDLLVFDNQLTKLDISRNIALISLNVHNNKLTELDVSKHTALTHLDIRGNQLKEINVSKNTALKRLDVSDNQLTEIDVSKNTTLPFLDVSKNQLTALDVSKNTALKNLYAPNNQLTEIDVSKNTELEILSVHANQLTELDLSKNTALTYLGIYNNPFPSSFAVYKSNEINLSSQKPLKLFNKKTSQFKSISDVIDEMNVNKEKISLNQPGTYNFKVNYTHDVQSNYNYFSIDYTAYVIEAVSDKYQINSEKDYIYTKTDTNKETILNNIDINYGNDTNENINITKEIIDNRLILKYNNEVLKTFDIVSISSSKYDLNKDYIYIGTEEFSLDDITVINGIKEIINNQLVIKYNNEVLKAFDLVRTSNAKYDLTKDYIYTGTEEINLDEVMVTNGTKEIINNQLVIKYNNKVLKAFDLVRISSTEYDLTKDYIYIRTKELGIDDITVTNGKKEITDNQLLIKYNDEVLKTFALLNIDFGSLKVGRNTIILTEEIPYSDFTSNITTNRVTYKIFNGEEEITDGNIKVGMTLKVYYNNEVLEEYSITDEYLTFDSSLNVDEENHLFKKVKEGTKVSELTRLISTSGNVTTLDKSDNEISNDEVLKTGDKIKIKLSKETLTYKVSVFGDVTGDGIVNIADVGKLYKHVRKTSIMTEPCELASSDIVEDNNIIITDVGKLYKYVRKVINEL